tara:strand:- start:402 stop:617 length:216 start_codon:yes stop_codon:yes gene_type:complete
MGVKNQFDEQLQNKMNNQGSASIAAITDLSTGSGFWDTRSPILIPHSKSQIIGFPKVNVWILDNRIPNFEV